MQENTFIVLTIITGFTLVILDVCPCHHTSLSLLTLNVFAGVKRRSRGGGLFAFDSHVVRRTLTFKVQELKEGMEGGREGGREGEGG